MSKFVRVERIASVGSIRVDIEEHLADVYFGVQSSLNCDQLIRWYFYFGPKIGWVRDVVYFSGAKRGQFYEQVDPRQAAYDIWKRFQKLPPELEEHRAIASNGEASRQLPEISSEKTRSKPKFKIHKCTLYLDDVAILRLRKRTSHKVAILLAFESKGWPNSITFESIGLKDDQIEAGLKQLRRDLEAKTDMISFHRDHQTIVCDVTAGKSTR